jgi:hypothetical protein
VADTGDRRVRTIGWSEPWIGPLRPREMADVPLGLGETRHRSAGQAPSKRPTLLRSRRPGTTAAMCRLEPCSAQFFRAPAISTERAATVRLLSFINRATSEAPRTTGLVAAG